MMSTQGKQQLCYQLSAVQPLESISVSLLTPDSGDGVVTGSASMSIAGQSVTALLVGNVQPDQSGFEFSLKLAGGQTVPLVKSINIDLEVDNDWNGEQADYKITLKDGKVINGQGPAQKIDCQ